MVTCAAAPAAVAACRLSYWWSNVLQLRWMVWALQDPQLGADEGGDARGSANGSGSKETAWLSEVGRLASLVA